MADVMLGTVMVRYDIFDPDNQPILPNKWADRAACIDVDPEIFFPTAQVGPLTSKEQVRVAKQICATCPVNQECKTYALMTNTKHGIWGGTTVIERRTMLRQRDRWSQCTLCGKVKFGDFRQVRCCNQGNRADEGKGGRQIGVDDE